MTFVSVVRFILTFHFFVIFFFRSKAHSKSKKVENIRCRFCKKPIQILLNRKDKDGNVVHTPVRKATGFARFVKEQYKNVKQGNNLKHADVMKALSENFSTLSVDEKAKYNN